MKKTLIATSVLVGLLLCAAPAQANDFITVNPNDWYRYENSRGQEVLNEMKQDLGGWRLWSQFGGLGQTYVYTTTSHDWFWLWNGSTYTLVGNLSGNVGDSRRIDGASCLAGATATIATRGPLTTPAGTFADCTELRFSGGPCADAGTTSVWFAKGVGIVRWTEQSFMGPVTYELKTAFVGGRTISAPAPAPTPTPSGRTVAPAEHDDMETILWGCNDSYIVIETYEDAFTGLNGSGVKSDLSVATQSSASQVRFELVQRNVPLDDVEIMVTALDTVWMRDYGPIILKAPNGDRIVADPEYYPGRNNDDAFPAAYAQWRGWPVVDIENVGFEGGNFATDGRDKMMCSNGVQWFNRHTTKSRIEREFRKFGFDRVEWFEPLVDEGTTHVDMFMRIMSDTHAMVSNYPNNHRQQRICNMAARQLQDMGYTVVRVDVDHNYDEFGTYTNSVLANGIALVPQYSNATKNRAALAAYRSMGYTAVGIDSRRIIRYSGATHCVSMQIPKGN